MKIKKCLLMGLFCSMFLAGPVYGEKISVSDFNQRLENLEKKVGTGNGDPGWSERITLSGAIEAEAGFSNKGYDDPATEDADESDIVLATVELGIDAEIHKFISGHLLLLWEEDDTDPIDMDEGYISINGEDRLPLYLNVGKFYLPFGNYETHMVTDPVTLEIGETNQSAVQVGFANDWIDASLALFNGDVDEAGDDDTIGGFAGSVQLSIPDGTISDVGLTTGLSYISNLADSDALAGELAVVDTVVENAAGWGAFFHVSFLEKAFLKLEYIGALDEFQAGDFSAIDGGTAISPSAWNVELAYSLLESLEIAVRYAQTDDIKGGIDDAGGYPESQYGLAAAYSLFDGGTVALEYLKNEYESNDELSVITAQLAVGF